MSVTKYGKEIETSIRISISTTTNVLFLEKGYADKIIESTCTVLPYLSSNFLSSFAFDFEDERRTLSEAGKGACFLLAPDEGFGADELFGC